MGLVPGAAAVEADDREAPGRRSVGLIASKTGGRPTTGTGRHLVVGCSQVAIASAALPDSGRLVHALLEPGIVGMLSVARERHVGRDDGVTIGGVGGAHPEADLE